MAEGLRCETGARTFNIELRCGDSVPKRKRVGLDSRVRCGEVTTLLPVAVDLRSGVASRAATRGRLSAEGRDGDATFEPKANTARPCESGRASALAASVRPGVAGRDICGEDGRSAFVISVPAGLRDGVAGPTVVVPRGDGANFRAAACFGCARPGVLGLTTCFGAALATPDLR